MTIYTYCKGKFSLFNPKSIIVATAILVFILMFSNSVSATPIDVSFLGWTTGIGSTKQGLRASGSFHFETDEMNVSSRRDVAYQQYTDDPTRATLDINVKEFSYNFELRDQDRNGLYSEDSSKIQFVTHDQDAWGRGTDLFQIEVYNKYKYYDEVLGLHEHIYTYMFITIESENQDFIIDGALPTNFSASWLGNHRASGYFKVSDKYFADVPSNPTGLLPISSAGKSAEFIISGFSQSVSNTNSSPTNLTSPSSLLLIIIGLIGVIAFPKNREIINLSHQQNINLTYEK